MRFQVEVHLARLLATLGLTDRGVAEELGINLAHFRRLREDNWTTISRPELQKLLCWGKRHGADLLTVEPSPVWRTLPGKQVVLLRGCDPSGNALPSDLQAEARLLEELKAEDCIVKHMSSAEIDAVKVKGLMKASNCIFIGSPKHNAATEHALAALWGLTPHDSRLANRSKAPVQFAWAKDSMRRTSAFSHSDGRNCGVYVSASGGRGRERTEYCVPADWMPADEYRRWTGRGRDAGILVVCRNPLGTEMAVTSIVLAGFSGFATVDMASDLVSDSLLVESDAVTPGRPVLRALSTLYKKPSIKDDSRVRISKGRRWFSPPWSQLRDLDAKAKGTRLIS